MGRRRRQGDPSLVVGYARTSTDRQVLGIDVQEEHLTRWCTQHQSTLIGIHVDQGVSGTTPADKREGLLDAIDTVRTRRAGTLLVVRRDRIARDVVIAAVVERLVERTGARIVTTSDAGAQDDTPEHRLMRTIVDAFAQYEGALTRERTRAAIRLKMARGEAVGYCAPYGQSIVAGRYVDDPTEQQLLEYIITLRRQKGWTLQKITDYLNRHHLDAARGERWHLKTVHRILQRREQHERSG